MKTNITTFYTIKPLGIEIVFHYSDDISLMGKASPDILNFIKDRVGHYDFSKNDDELGFNLHDINQKPAFLFVKKQRNKEKTREILLHELIHLVDLLSKYFCFEDEMEFRAYLFCSIYKDLWGIMQKAPRY
jgi:hypothetical protein